MNNRGRSIRRSDLIIRLSSKYTNSSHLLVFEIKSQIFGFKMKTNPKETNKNKISALPNLILHNLMNVQ